VVPAPRAFTTLTMAAAADIGDGDLTHIEVLDVGRAKEGGSPFFMYCSVQGGRTPSLQ
jgi:hypothetical protein